MLLTSKISLINRAMQLDIYHKKSAKRSILVGMQPKSSLVLPMLVAFCLDMTCHNLEIILTINYQQCRDYKCVQYKSMLHIYISLHLWSYRYHPIWSKWHTRHVRLSSMHSNNGLNFDYMILFANQIVRPLSKDGKSDRKKGLGLTNAGKILWLSSNLNVFQYSTPIQ